MTYKFKCPICGTISDHFKIVKSLTYEEEVIISSEDPLITEELPIESWQLLELTPEPDNAVCPECFSEFDKRPIHFVINDLKEYIYKNPSEENL